MRSVDIWRVLKHSVMHNRRMFSSQVLQNRHCCHLKMDDQATPQHRGILGYQSPAFGLKRVADPDAFHSYSATSSFGNQLTFQILLCLARVMLTRSRSSVVLSVLIRWPRMSQPMFLQLCMQPYRLRSEGTGSVHHHLALRGE